MQIGAIWRGVAVGLVVAGLLALILAVVATHITVSVKLGDVLIWTASGLTTLVTGFVTGSLSEHAGWLHGALAALMLSLIGTALAETVHIYNGHGLWLSLGMALGMGLVGGVIGASRA